MTVAVLVNRLAGTVRSIGAEKLQRNLKQVAEERELAAEIAFVHPKELDGATADAAARSSVEAVVVGGGDGTLSSAASILSSTSTPLGILPLGTMNLYARALRVPLDPVEALGGLAERELVRSDLGDVNGRRFTHHVTLGLHPRMIRLREAAGMESKILKRLAAIRAWFKAFRRPPLHSYDITIDGERQRLDASSLILTNNLLEEGLGQLPYQALPDRNLIALYHTAARRRSELATLSVAALAGKWQSNPQMEMKTARVVEIATHSNRFTLSVDGELVRLREPLRITSLPKALAIVRPRAHAEDAT